MQTNPITGPFEGVHPREARGGSDTVYDNPDLIDVRDSEESRPRSTLHSKKPRVSLFWQVFTATGAAIGVVPAAYYFFTLEERIYRTR